MPVRTLLDRAGEATALAKFAFANGNESVGITAICLAAQLVKLARLQQEISDNLR